MAPKQPIAIIGMACLFPRSTGLKEFWRLLYNAKDAITDVPATHWSATDYFDQDPKKPDHVYCTRGGFLSPVSFDSSEFGIPPASLEATDTSQLLGLMAAKAALEDAGYGPDTSFNRDRTSVILGVTGTQELVISLGSRLGHPHWRKALESSGISPEKTEEIIQKISDSYVGWHENSFPGLLGNVVAGRISNRLDLGGTNCVVDAACASSMSAIHLAMLELSSGRSDMVVTGGVDTLNDIFMHMCFSKTYVLSPSGDVRPFAKDADGTVLGEGVGILVLRRLEDAQREGNKIYAVIMGLGSSSDGKSQSIYAPRVEGQAKALRNAYQEAGVDPATVKLIEAHGTGTRVGDRVEVKALSQVFGQPGINGNRCALGSVKSMIGHTKAAAGTAGVIKAALALYHKVLPPTLKVSEPDPDLAIDKSPFYLNTETRPWLSDKTHPRRSGVSAFGFGGSNFHMVLEEYRREKTEVSWDGSVDIAAFAAHGADQLRQKVKRFQHEIEQNNTPDTVASQIAQTRKKYFAEAPYRLLVVFEENQNPSELLTHSLAVIASKDPIKTKGAVRNIFFGGPDKPQRLAFVFPGQGSQYTGMGRDIVCMFPAAMQVLEKVNQKFDNGLPLSEYIYPRPTVAPEEKNAQDNALKDTAVAQPAIGTISLALLRVLQSFGVSPDFTCGHSFGELTALCAAGWMSEDDFLELAISRGKLMAAAGQNPSVQRGSMLAVQAPLEELQALIEADGLPVVLANRNSPNQAVLSGPAPAIDALKQKCHTKGFKSVTLPVAAAFHSPQVKAAQKPFIKALQHVRITPSPTAVFSNTTGQAYPADADAAKHLLADHLICPVDFVAEIENLYQAGVQTFVEVGPKSVLTGLLRSILKGRSFNAMAMDASAAGGNGIGDLARTLCQLASLGYAVDLQKWEYPLSAPRRAQLSIPLSGANYRRQKPENRNHRIGVLKNKPEPATHSTNTGVISSTDKVNLSRQEFNTHLPPGKIAQPFNHPVFQTSDSTEEQDTMDNNNEKRSKYILDALRIVQEGLKSMQTLQTQTAQTHQKFLEAQTEASKTLQEMMNHTQRLTEASLGLGFGGIIPNLSSNHVAPSIEAKAAAQPESSTSESNLSLEDPAKVSGGLPQSTHPVTYWPDADELAETHAGRSLQEAGFEKVNDTPVQTRKEIEATLLAVVAELTGYPVEMIGLDMDIEADLGIDSIKRVEILSTLEENVSNLPKISPEIMGTLKTLGQIIAFLSANDPIDVKTDSEIKRSQLDAASTRIENDRPSPSAKNNIVNSLLAVVSQLTGYPVATLGLDMDIEADLGIDSIKRVEILSTLEEEIPNLPPISPEVMGGLKTLGQIADYLCPSENDRPSPGGPVPVSAGDPPASGKQDRHAAPRAANASAIPASDTIERKIVTAVKEPFAPAARLTIAQNRTVFVTDDNTGLSSAIVNEFASLGINASLIPADIVKYDPPLSGAGGLMIVQDPASKDPYQDLHNAFLLTKHLAADLTAAANNGGALLTTITRLDGAFGLKGAGVKNPLQGALAGLVKTAAKEWKGVCCHALDLSPLWHDPLEMAREVIKEALTPGPLEVGLEPAARYGLVMEFQSDAKDDLEIDSKDVIVISGGARGVTAAAAVALAKQIQPTLVLLGRSPEPFSEPAWLASIEDEPTMKRAILENEFGGKTSTPAQIEKAFQTYQANREICRNLDALKSTGARAQYFSVDVRNADRVQAVMRDVRCTYGPIRAIIHAAGVLEDRLIIDKTPEQFEKVFSTKVQGLENLLQATRDDPLKHLVIFSSIAARMGNKGQVDYAMANEALNKIAQQESANRTDCRVVSINWGPWDGGMVHSALKREFERNGIELIPTEFGAACLLSEMMRSKDSPVEVVIAGTRHIAMDKTLDQSLRPVPKSPAPVQRTSQFSLAFEREIDIEAYPILKSHIIKGTPVVPLALMTEWFAHGALHENPGLYLHGIDEMRVLKGIRLNRHKVHIRLLVAKPQRKDSLFEVAVELRDGKKAGTDIIHSRAKAILSDILSPAPDFQLAKHLDQTPYPRSVEEIYNKILFHGVQLHGIRKIITCSPRGMVAQISSAPPPAEWMKSPLRNRWLADPLVLDSAFQMATVWCFEEKGVVSLPSYSASYRQFRHQFPSDVLTVVLEVRNADEHKMRADFTFLDTDEQVVAQLKGYEATMDASLYEAFKPQYALSA